MNEYLDILCAKLIQPEEKLTKWWKSIPIWNDYNQMLVFKNYQSTDEIALWIR